MTLKVVTINILSDLSRWEIRRELLVDQLAKKTPDIIALQEVSLPENPTIWVARQLSRRSINSNPYEVYLTPKTGSWGRREAISMICRLPVKNHEMIPLGGQGRVAQRILVEFNRQNIYLTNVHLFWQPGISSERIKQVERLVDWMEEVTNEFPTIICGDFNDTPDSEAIQLMRTNYKSVYKAVHHEEPAYTCPTPLPVSIRANIRTILRFLPFIRLRSIKPKWRGTLDYIFVNEKISIQDAMLSLNKPHTTKSKIYPSDHFGIYAEFRGKV